MFTLTQLKYILAVDEHKHFGKAAKSCHVSQPSLSAQIQKLEDTLGEIIFDRTQKPILTTDIGRKILSQARKILFEVNQIPSLIQSESAEVSGDFNLAIIPTLSPYLLPLFIKEFSTKYPLVNLNIHELQTDEILSQFEEDKIDAGILVTPLNNDRIIERHLFYEPFFLFCSKDHEYSKKKILSEEQIKKKDFWLLEEGHCFRNQILNVCKIKHDTNVLTNIKFESGNLETLKNLIIANSGYTLLPLLATRNLSTKQKETHLRKIKKPVPTREVSLVHSRTYWKEKIIIALEQEIISALPKELKSLKRNQLEIIEID